MLLKREGPLLNPRQFRETKDPCPVFDGKQWHLYGSGGDTNTESWEIYHATAPSIDGPWTEQEPAKLAVEGPRVAAPGVIYDVDEQMFHMFVQTDFMRPDGTIEHLLSSDGERFNNFGTVLRSILKFPEAGIYDPHPAIIHEEKYIVYSGMAEAHSLDSSNPLLPQNIADPEIYLAKSTSNSWYGPWERLGRILSHEEVPHHNQRNNPNYEWGLEGAQLIELPNGKVLLNAVCFLPDKEWRTRQRVFFAIADEPQGPYKTLGPMLEPRNNNWENGENGHAAGIVFGEKLHLFYQARAFDGLWRYGKAVFDPYELAALA